MKEAKVGPSIAPLMSVVITTPDDFNTIRTTMSHLCAQTVRGELEIIIVAPSREGLHLDKSMMSVFARYEVVELNPICSVGRANSAGIRRATSRVVALAEDHCFPASDWAETLMKSHDGPWSVVGPSVRNANPSTAVSWADFLIGYGPWVAPNKPGEMEFLPGHNSSYKRDVLLSYGPRLDAMMDAETVLHWDLRNHGHRLYLEPAASVAHTNFSRWSSWLRVQFYNGQLFAGTRARQMTWLRRMLYILGAFLIPLVRLMRIVRDCQQRRSRLLRYLPAIAIGLVVDGMGQLIGYVFGTGNALQQVSQFEFHRLRHVAPQDRRVFDTLCKAEGVPL